MKHRIAARLLTIAVPLCTAGAGPASAQVLQQAPAPAGGVAAKGGFVEPDQKPLSTAAADILQRINAYRAAGATCGSSRMEPAGPLEWNEALQRAADVQVRDIAPQATVSHSGSDGSDVGTRVRRQGYEWGTVGENAAAGRSTAAATLEQWMGSPGHCGNMMGAEFRHVAVVGVQAPGTTYTHYWIMVLAAPMAGR
jgi:uncharacterized protein YkwD